MRIAAAGLMTALLFPRAGLAVCNFTTNKIQTLTGTTLTYNLIVQNNTGSGFRGLYVTDTVSPALMNQTSDAPPLWGTATVYQTASGTMYTWSYDLGGSGPSIGGAGAIFTFTITGTLTDACALFGIANTAVFHVAGSGCSGFAANGANTVATSANLAVALIQTPPSPAAGTPVTYTIQVTNTGTVTLDALSVNDTVTTAVTGAVLDTPAGFAATGPVPTGGGNWFQWNDTGSLAFVPGDTLTFTVTGLVTGTCVSADITNTAFASAMTLGCGASATCMTSNVTDFSIVTYPAAITASLFQTGGLNSGDPVTYQLVVTNTGSATLVNATIVDTIPGFIVNQSADQPVEMGVPLVSQVAGGTRYVWSASGFTLSPTGSFTFTVSGNIGVVCVPTAISVTAFADASASCGGAQIVSNPVGSEAGPATGSITVAAVQSPPGPGTGQPVTWQIVVTNAGSATLTSLTVMDTIAAAAATGPVASQPPGWAAPAMLSAGAGGTLFVWSRTGFSFSPDTSLTFTVTGVVGLVCSETDVSTTAFASAGGACVGTTDAPANNTWFAVESPAAGLVISQAASGGGGAGAPVTWQIVVTNVGAATMANLTLTDSVSPLLMNQAPSQPAEMGPPTVTGAGSSGTRYVWSAAGMPTGLQPGKSFTFTVTGVAGTICSPADVSNTAWLEASGGCSATVLMTTAVDVTITPPVSSLAVVKTQIPAAPGSGGPVTYRIVVTNTGAATVTTLLVTDTIAPAVTGETGDQPPGWAAATVLQAAPSGTLIVWSNNALTFGPGTALTFTITGTVGSCISGVVSNTSFVSGGSACTYTELTDNETSFQVGPVLVAAASVRPVASVGYPYTVVLTVTNTGDDDATNVTPDLSAGPGSALTTQFAGPSPAGPLTLAPGAAQSFTWTFSADGAGVVTFTGTANGVSCGGGALLGAATVSCTLQSPPSLAGWFAQYAPPRDVGQSYLVTLTVTNGGQATATGVDIAGLMFGGSGGAAVVAGPTPGLPVSIAGGKKLTFTWTFTGAAPGLVTLSTTLSGTDSNTGLAIPPSVAVSNTMLIQTPAALNASATLLPGQVSTGQWFTLALTVTNTGQASATLVTPALVDGSGALLTYRTGPTPAGPVTLTGGGAQTFKWTYSPDGAGALFFSLSAAGLDANTGAIIFAGRTITGLAQIRAALVAGLSLSATSAGSGGAFAVTLTVTDTGQAATTGLKPPVLLLSGFGSATVAAGGWPSSAPVTLAGGARLTWTYTFTAGLSGIVSFAGQVTGADGNAGWAVTAVAVPPLPLKVGSPQFGILSFAAAPASVGLDQIVTLVMTVSNTGRYVLDGLSPGAVGLNGDGRMELVSGPQPPALSGVLPGDTVTFTWTFRSLRGGIVTFGAGLTAAGTPPPPPATSNPIRIVEAGTSLVDAVVYPTPFNPDTAMGGVLKFRKMPPFSTASVYTNAGELVRTMTADLNGTAVWDGRNDSGSRVFPGVYFYLLKSPAGEKRKGKFEVAN